MPRLVTWVKTVAPHRGEDVGCVLGAGLGHLRQLPSGILRGRQHGRCQTALDALIREANGMLASDVLTTQEAKDGLSKAIEAASAVGELTPEVYKEQTESLNAAIKFGQESMDAAAALETKVTAHDAKLSGNGEASYEEYSDTEGYEELYDLTLKSSTK